MFSFNEFGNKLYTGKLSFPFVARRRLWFIIAIALVVGSVLVPLIRPIQFSIEFTGGSQFTVQAPQSTDQALATEAVQSVVPDAATKVVVVGGTDVRVQTDQMTASDTQAVTEALAKAYGHYCQDQSKKHVAGQKGTPFSQCVTAMAKAAHGQSGKSACGTLSKKHVAGEKGTPYSRCVTAAAQLHKDQHTH